jgi:CRISPR-associated protein Cmr6
VISESALGGEVYGLAFQRWKNWWENQEGVICFKGSVRTRFISGLGSESVHEVALRLNHTYGVPVIPGSSIKGILRSRILDETLANALFGSVKGAAFTEFQDAWWIPDNGTPLALDVMTVHHPEYYTGKDGTRQPPSDFDNPTPIPFLSVRGRFLFVARCMVPDPDGQWRSYLLNLMKDTLEIDGVGGKRSSGYGRFSFEP